MNKDNIIAKIKKLDDIYKLDLGINENNNKEKENNLNKYFLKDEFIIKKR